MKYWITSFFKDSKEFLEIKRRLDELYEYSEEDFEYLFVLGGDGSFIYFFKEYAFSNKKLIGIKSGHVSFLSNFLMEEDFDIKDKKWENIELLEIKEVGTWYALNDIYISGELLLDLNVEINDVYFERFRGTALLISTKTGSTAHNKSINGPVVFPDSRVWLINGIGTQSNNIFKSLNNTLVLSYKDSIRLYSDNAFKIHIDGKRIDNAIKELSIKIIEGNSMVIKNDSSKYIERLRRVFT